jgi:hypothetical protein
MKYVVILTIVLVVVLAYAAYYTFSTAKHDPDVWHVDPMIVERSSSPNDYLVEPHQSATPMNSDTVAGVYALSAEELAQAFDMFVLEQSSAARLAGLPSDLHMTYVDITPRIKAPDYISVKFIPLSDQTSTLAMFSRSRYGYGDLGANRRRVENWLGGISAYAQSAQ